jgi:hypothetical protein
MIRVFLDANGLFSTSNAGSNIARLIHLLIKQGQAIASDFGREEATRNILLKRSGWAEALEHILGQIQIVSSIQFDLEVELGAKDKPILCAAIRSDAQYLATGDKQNFGHLYDHTVEGVTIISLARLAELLIQ